ncbi:fimbrial protein StdA [Salmonella enterica]|nr:fimbrial protein StdA [Salmonella enterica]
MRNKLLPTMVAAGMMMYGVSAFAADPLPSDSFGKGTINFDGTITNAPCDITGGGDSAVHFGSIASKNVTATESHPQPFSIRLSNCTLTGAGASGSNPPAATDITKATVTFSLGGTGSLGTGGDVLHASGDTNVGIKVKNDTSGKFLKLDGTHTTDNDIPLITSASSQSLNFTAYLVSDAASGGVVKPGDFSASAVYTLAYN